MDLKKKTKLKDHPNIYQWWHVSCIPRTLLFDIQAETGCERSALGVEVHKRFQDRATSAKVFALSQEHALLLGLGLCDVVPVEAKPTGCVHVKRCKKEGEEGYAMASCVSGVDADRHAG